MKSLFLDAIAPTPGEYFMYAYGWTIPVALVVIVVVIVAAILIRRRTKK